VSLCIKEIQEMEGNRYVVDEICKILTTNTTVVFEVKDHCAADDFEIAIVPVILKYKFMWGLYGSGGKTVGVLIERFLDPTFKDTSKWKEIDRNRQSKIDTCVKKKYHSKQFSKLLKFRQGLLTTLMLACVLEEGKSNERWEIDDAPLWSIMPSKYIEDLSKEMKKVFNMDLEEMRDFKM